MAAALGFDALDIHRCECDTDYEWDGDECRKEESTVSCATGYRPDGNDCEDIDEVSVKGNRCLGLPVPS